MKIYILFCLVSLVFGQDCPPGQFPCPGNGVCIPLDRICDGLNDCIGGEDEVNCPSTTTTQCPGFVCPGSGECIPDYYVCDNFHDCPGGEDEVDCPCDGFQCNDGICIPGHWVCDGFTDCSGSEDEVHCTCFQCPEPDYACIPERWVCDGLVDCVGGEDEVDCPCDGFRCENGRCINGDWVCDGEDDCFDWSDEGEEVCPCADDEMRCHKPPGTGGPPGACIPPEYVCDEEGIWDCPDGSDEANCTTLIKHENVRLRYHRPGKARNDKFSKMMKLKKVKHNKARKQRNPKSRIERKIPKPFVVKKSKKH